VRRLVDERGQDEVEAFLDACLSLDNLVDPWGPLRERLKGPRRAAGPAADLEAVLRRGRGDERRAPTCDVLGFLLDRAPLAEWQRSLLRIVRAESIYFLPQRLTKVMNEGWASFWHARIMVEGGLSHAEIVDFADCHSGAVAAAPGRLNPYKLGIELFRVAEERGLDLFRLRRAHHDVTLIDELVDEEFAARVELFATSTGPDGRTRSWREKKEELLRALSNGSAPRIELVEDDHLRRGELLLVHHHDGRDLDAAPARAVLENLARLWGRAVHLDTVARGASTRLSARPEPTRRAG
jgi:stage V sporulation protein R